MHIRITHVVEELGTGVALDIVTVEVAPAKLHINPELVACSTVQDILALQQICKTAWLSWTQTSTHVCDERWASNVPLYCTVSMERLLREGMLHTLYAEKSRISAHEEFIL